MAIIMLLEVILKKELLRLISAKNITDFMFIIESLNNKKEYFNHKFDHIFFDKFANFLVNYCFLYEFSFDKMNSNLKILERFFENLYFSDDFLNIFLNKANDIFFNSCEYDNFYKILLMKEETMKNKNIEEMDTYLYSSEYEIETRKLLLDSNLLENLSFFDNFEFAIVIIFLI